jgi:hypothetical protein
MSGMKLHREAHLRRPEAGEVVPSEQGLAGAPPALELLGPVTRRGEREHRVIARGAENVDDAEVLQVPKQRPAVDDAVDAGLEGGVGQGLQQRPGQREVNPA